MMVAALLSRTNKSTSKHFFLEPWHHHVIDSMQHRRSLAREASPNLATATPRRGVWCCYGRSACTSAHREPMSELKVIQMMEIRAQQLNLRHQSLPRCSKPSGQNVLCKQALAASSRYEWQTRSLKLRSQMGHESSGKMPARFWDAMRSPASCNWGSPDLTSSAEGIEESTTERRRQIT